jgi:hypothetical protein
MPRSAAIVLTATFLATPGSAQPVLEITLKEGTAREAQTRNQLQRLLRTYDVSPWVFTKSIVIDERSTPHSHPVLTLHARHLKDDDLLLSTFVHEQFHWPLAQKSELTEEAIKELRGIFPTGPGRMPEGAQDEHSTYLHLLVCYLERHAIQQLLGELRARQVMEFWATDHDTWIYRTVLDRPRDIGSIVAKYKLNPTGRSG